MDSKYPQKTTAQLCLQRTFPQNPEQALPPMRPHKLEHAGDVHMVLDDEGNMIGAIEHGPDGVTIKVGGVACSCYTVSPRALWNAAVVGIDRADLIIPMP